MKKAVAAVLLAVLLVCAVFSSCGKKEDGALPETEILLAPPRKMRLQTQATP